MAYILREDAPLPLFQEQGGGKALNLARVTGLGVPVPTWFCLSAKAFDSFINMHHLADKLVHGKDLRKFSADIEKLFLSLPLPPEVQRELKEEMEKTGFNIGFVAVRSSGLDEDSPGYSFAGQFSSFLFQKGEEAVEKAVKLCWASAYSERGLSYRIKHGLPTSRLGMGVVIQQMVDAESSGVVFSRNPIEQLNRNHVVVSAVWGLGEGLVSGALDADHYLYDREDRSTKSDIVEKRAAFRQSPDGGVVQKSVAEKQWKDPALNGNQLQQVVDLALLLEEKYGSPQDCEWAFAKGKLYCLQTRPITNLPPEAMYNDKINGKNATLWDNSNIIESYSGVVAPLTFTFASYAYREVYIQFCKVIGIPQKLIDEYQPVFRNMLGQIRGRIYYNLINWYKLVVLLPGTTNNKEFMETMMGVRQGLSVEAASLFDFANKPPTFSLWHKIKLVWLTLYRFLTIDSIVTRFHDRFDKIYNKARKTDFTQLSLPKLAEIYTDMEENVLKKWQAPIINDCLCMVFFGLLKKYTQKWIEAEGAGSIQNDLLCGQGDLESTEPTKMLMRMAEKIDKEDGFLREWLLSTPATEIWQAIKSDTTAAWLITDFKTFLDKYGFRCVNELKLEEMDLHDDPTFAINNLISYVRMKTYSIKAMEERERAIKTNAEAKVSAKLSGWRKTFYFWILKHARKAIRNRENLRFARTKIFGVIRHLFRAMGGHFVQLQLLHETQDVFYLTVDDIFGFIEGRSSTGDLKGLADHRKNVFAEFRRTAPPPDRFATYGTVGMSILYPQVLASGDLSPPSKDVSNDPTLLKGTPCCPGIVEGVVRVVEGLHDAEGLNGEILVTERTDPGWVPLYPSCSGLLIERGSLLSHSAVVARELGLPTIVGVSGGLMKRLKTGDRVRVDAGKGEIRIMR